MKVGESSYLVTEAGFTLLEMLVVLTILAIVVTIASPFLSKQPDGVSLRATSSELATALRVTRSAAIVRNSETTLLIDVNQRTFRSDVVPQRSFPQSIDAELKFAFPVRVSQFDGGFRFFGDGSSTGGELTLLLHGRRANICVDWLTGAVKEQEAC